MRMVEIATDRMASKAVATRVFLWRHVVRQDKGYEEATVAEEQSVDRQK